MNTQVGFIGLGRMGAPMARNLLRAGFPLTVWNRTREKIAPLAEAGAVAASSPREVGQRADVIFTMVTDAPQVRELVLGDEGVIRGAAAGAVIVDTSSISPSAAREIARQVEAGGMTMLDAPVSGGPEGAEKGALAIMVGGAEESFREVLPILQVLGKTIVHVGPPGMGQLFKLCNQAACALNILAMAEALALAKRAGADLALVRKVLLGGAAGSWMLENWAPKIIEGDYGTGFTVANFQKDLRNVLDEAAALNLPLPGTALAHQLYRGNEAAGESEESNVAIYKVLLRLAGERGER